MTNPAKTGLEALTGDVVVADLSSLALIEVRGDDAQSFLQGQLSNDVDAIGHGSGGARPSQLNAYCNPKGRVLAVLRLVRHAGGFWMLAPAGLADGLVKRLKMYVLRAKVDIALQPEMALLGLINGDDADVGDGIERLLLGGTGGVGGGIGSRQILLGEKQVMDSFVRAGGHEPEPDDDLWRLADIRSGIPQVYAQTAEAFIPQMINLDLVDGLSFTKGCYPGQEIVARLRYRGKAKQRMLAGTVSGVENLAPGAPVYAEQRGDQKAGVVVDAVKTGDGEYTLSATAPANLAEAGTLLVGSASGSALIRIPLPYSVPTE